MHHGPGSRVSDVGPNGVPMATKRTCARVDQRVWIRQVSRQVSNVAAMRKLSAQLFHLCSDPRMAPQPMTSSQYCQENVGAVCEAHTVGGLLLLVGRSTSEGLGRLPKDVSSLCCKVTRPIDHRGTGSPVDGETSGRCRAIVLLGTRLAKAERRSAGSWSVFVTSDSFIATKAH